MKLATASGDAIDRNSDNRSTSADRNSAISQSRENRVQATPERRTDSVGSSMDFSDDPQKSCVPMVQLAITMRNIAKCDEKSYAIESDQYPIDVPEVDVATQTEVQSKATPAHSTTGIADDEKSQYSRDSGDNG